VIHQFEPVAAAIAAQHCAALRGRCTVPAALVPLLDQLGERLAPALEQDLARFSGSGRPKIVPLGSERMTEAELAERVGPLAGNALQAIAGGPHRLLVSVEMHAVLAELDRTFGGNGDVGEELPAVLPMSADRLSARLEQLLADSFRAALPMPCELRPVERHVRYTLLEPFPEVIELALLTLEVTQPMARPWIVRFAVPLVGLPDLLDRRRSAPRHAVARPPADPRDKPFADVPLTLEATLIDMALPLSRLARLEPGAILPVSVSRSVPLRIGDTVVGHGTVGELDDRTALQITHTPLSGDTQP
jgi:flagellar motor switch protein FliM